MRAEQIAEALGQKQRAGKRFKCCCPAHDDKNPSLCVWDKPDGGIGFRCYAGCTFADVREKLQSGGLLLGTAGNKPTFLKREERKERARRGEIREIVTPVPSDAPEPDFKAYTRSR